MEDLNDKITNDDLTALEWNQMPSELQNIIEGTGQTLSGADLNQVGKGIANYAANGDFYTDGGSANQYILSVIGSKQGPTEYTNGMRVRFIGANTSTTTSTINVNVLGNKALVRSDGTDLQSPDVDPAVISEAVYVLASDHFRLNGSADKFLPQTIGNDWTWADDAKILIGTDGDVELFFDTTLTPDSLVLNLLNSSDYIIQKAGTNQIFYDNSLEELLFTNGCDVHLADDLRISFGTDNDTSIRYRSASSALQINMNTGEDLLFTSNESIIFQFDDATSSFLYFQDVTFNSNINLIDDIEIEFGTGNAARINFDTSLTVDSLVIDLNGAVDFHLRDVTTTRFFYDNSANKLNFQNGCDILLDNNLQYQAKTLGGTTRTILTLDATDQIEVGHNSHQMELRNNGTCILTNHGSEDPDLHQITPMSMVNSTSAGGFSVAKNVTSITKGTTGLYTINLTTAIGEFGHTATVQLGQTNPGSSSVDFISTTSYLVKIIDTVTGNLTDRAFTFTITDMGA